MSESEREREQMNEIELDRFHLYSHHSIEIDCKANSFTQQRLLLLSSVMRFIVTQNVTDHNSIRIVSVFHLFEFGNGFKVNVIVVVLFVQHNLCRHLDHILNTHRHTLHSTAQRSTV